MPDTRQYVFVDYEPGDSVGYMHDVPFQIRRQVRTSDNIFTKGIEIPGGTTLKALRFIVKGNYASSYLNALQLSKLKAVGAVSVSDLSTVDYDALKKGGRIGNATIRNLKAALEAAGVYIPGGGWPSEVVLHIQVLPEAVTVARLMSGGDEEGAEHIVELAAQALTGKDLQVKIEDVKQGLTLQKQEELAEAQKAVRKIRKSLSLLDGKKKNGKL